MAIVSIFVFVQDESIKQEHVCCFFQNTFTKCEEKSSEHFIIKMVDKLKKFNQKCENFLIALLCTQFNW